MCKFRNQNVTKTVYNKTLPLYLCIMVVAQDDLDQHTKVDDKCDAIQMEKAKLLDVEIRIDKALEAYQEHLDTFQQCLNKR